jgi:hypothetical protein
MRSREIISEICLGIVKRHVVLLEQGVHLEACLQVREVAQRYREGTSFEDASTVFADPNAMDGGDSR